MLNDIGVEYSRHVATICRKEVQELGMANKCEVLVGDGADFRFPGGNLRLLQYNPFDSTLFLRVLKNLVAVKGKVRMAQLYPGCEITQQSGMAGAICRGEGPTIYEVLGHLAARRNR